MDIAVEDRIRGVILGAACASSLGGACLGLKRKEIMFAVGVHGIRDFASRLPQSILPDYEPGRLLADTLLFFDPR